MNYLEEHNKKIKQYNDFGSKDLLGEMIYVDGNYGIATQYGIDEDERYVTFIGSDPDASVGRLQPLIEEEPDTDILLEISAKLDYIIECIIQPEEEPVESSPDIPIGKG